MANSLKLHITPETTTIRLESRWSVVASAVFSILPISTLLAMVLGVIEIVQGANGIALYVLTAIMPFATIRLVRLWLWNSGGAEEIVLTKTEVQVLYDYRFWKDSQIHEVDGPVDWEYIPMNDGKKDSAGRFHITGLNEELVSVLTIKESVYHRHMTGADHQSLEGIIDSPLPSSSDT